MLTTTVVEWNGRNIYHVYHMCKCRWGHSIMVVVLDNSFLIRYSADNSSQLVESIELVREILEGMGVQRIHSFAKAMDALFFTFTGS